MMEVMVGDCMCVLAGLCEEPLGALGGTAQFTTCKPFLTYRASLYSVCVCVCGPPCTVCMHQCMRACVRT